MRMLCFACSGECWPEGRLASALKTEVGCVGEGRVMASSAPQTSRVPPMRSEDFDVGSSRLCFFHLTPVLMLQMHDIPSVTPIGLQIDCVSHTTTSAKHGPASAEASSRASCGDLSWSHKLNSISSPQAGLVYVGISAPTSTTLQRQPALNCLW